MLKPIKYLAFIILSLYSCSDNSINEPIYRASRTILVYMVANNSLGSGGYDNTDIQEMIDAAKSSSFNGGRLLVYHAPKSGNPSLKEITSRGENILIDYDNDIYSTDPQRMEQVISDMQSLAPANDYGLILWSHANAWIETSTSKSISDNNNIINPNAFGEDRGHHMKNTSLAKVLDGKGFSFIYFDCCHMASIEVAYELKNSTQHIIGSATELLADGMPYNQNIPLLFKETPDLKQACCNTFDYYNILSGSSRSCTISLIDTRQIDELATISRKIFSAGTEVSTDYTPQAFVRGSNCFLFDFAHYMHELSPNDEIKTHWDNALNNVVKYKAATPSILNKLNIETHCGLGCYIVKNISYSTYKGYDNQNWWKDVVSYHF